MNSFKGFGKLTVTTEYADKEEVITVEWAIEDWFSCHERSGLAWESGTFHICDGIWHLKIMKIFTYCSSPMIELYLVNDKLASFVPSNCTFGIKNKNGIVNNVGEIKLFQHNRNNKTTQFLISKICVDESTSENPVVASNETPLFSLRITFKNILAFALSSTNEPKGTEILSKNLKTLFLNEEACDVTFKVKDTEIRTHRTVLIAGSPVFAAMFRHQMSEAITGIITIPDCTPDAFKALLLYLYSGTVENLSTDIVYDLYEATIKYDLEYLKNKCIKFMKDETSSDTLCDIIAFCKIHMELDLLQHATNYFTEHLLDILVTVKWQSFLREYPVAANELYIKAVQKIINAPKKCLFCQK